MVKTQEVRDIQRKVMETLIPEEYKQFVKEIPDNFNNLRIFVFDEDVFFNSIKINFICKELHPPMFHKEMFSEYIFKEIIYYLSYGCQNCKEECKHFNYLIHERKIDNVCLKCHEKYLDDLKTKYQVRYVKNKGKLSSFF